MIFTTSWDDGYKSDLRTAKMLSNHGATGTFYLCPKKQHAQEMLTEGEMHQLSVVHEIGAHSMNHPKLSKVPLEEARTEIIESKQWIESLSGKTCDMFCYPYGDFNEAVANLVEEAGYKAARTVVDLKFSREKNMFTLPVSLHVYPMPMRTKFTRWWHPLDIFGPMRVRWSRLNAIGIPLLKRRSWQSLAQALFIHALESNAPFFHLWGHSFELDKFNMWGELDTFLSFVSQHDVQHVTNSELVASLL